MKRLALAAAVALAVTTIGFAPAAADNVNDNPTSSVSAPTDNPDDSTSNDNAASDASGGSASDDSDGNHTDPPAENPDENTPPADDNTGDASGETPGDDPAAEADPTEEAVPIEATFTLLTKQLTSAEIRDPDLGIRYLVHGLKAGDTITSDLGGSNSTTAPTDGTFEGTIIGDSEIEAGTTVDFTVTVTREGSEPVSFDASVDIIADEDPAVDPTLEVTPGSQELDSFLDNGVELSISDCAPDTDVQFRISSVHDPDTEVWSGTEISNENGAATMAYVPPEVDDGYGFIGEYLVMATCGEAAVNEAYFTVTPNGTDTIEPNLKVNPTTIDGVDFVNENKGVTLTTFNCGMPGDNVRFEVWGTDPSELLYEKTVPVNEARTASVKVYGLENLPAAYVGTYKVSATCGDTILEGEFEVTGGNSGDGGDSGSGDSGNAGDIPRTGIELTGLGLGLALTILGAAAVIFARRRSQTE